MKQFLLDMLSLHPHELTAAAVVACVRPAQDQATEEHFECSIVYFYLQIDCIALVPHMRGVINLRSGGINCVNKSVDMEGQECLSCCIHC